MLKRSGDTQDSKSVVTWKCQEICPGRFEEMKCVWCKGSFINVIFTCLYRAYVVEGVHINDCGCWLYVNYLT